MSVLNAPTSIPHRMRRPLPRIAPTTTALCDLAESEGIAVIWTPCLGDPARWYNAERIIEVRTAMAERATVSVIAHELGHYWHGDRRSSPEAERRAWRFAGELLVDGVTYADAEQHHASVGAIARELGVLTDVVKGYQASLLAVPARAAA